MISHRKHPFGVYLFMAVLLLLGAAISLSIGSAGISIGESVSLALFGIPGISWFIDPPGNEMHLYIIQQVRIPRILLSILVGGGLSVSGCVFQGIFRNPLAEPHILGVSAGAALGACIAILLGIQTGTSLAGMGAVGLCAFAGAVITIGIVYFASGLGGRSSVISVLLTGSAVSTMFSAIMSLLMSMNHERMEQVYLWTMGSFSAASWSKIRYTVLFLVPLFGVCLAHARELNLLAMGEETAQSLGVETLRIRKILIPAASFLTAVCVSVSGVVGFVGLVIPHIMRFLLGSDYRKILPGSILGGALFLMVCDTLARTLIAPGELPVGVLTAIVGAPYLIILIRRSGKDRS